MLKGISSLICADLLWVLRSMGHGDNLALVDRNFPAHSVAAKTVYGKPIQIAGSDTTDAASAILQLMPLDFFVESSVQHMQVVGEPDAVLDVHKDLLQVCNESNSGPDADKPVVMQSIERFEFYRAATQSFAVVQTAEDRPYGCFILKKGVVFD